MNFTHQARRSGFTLPEVLVGLGAAALLMVGLASTTFLAGRALNPNAVKAVQTKQASDVFDELASDLTNALSFSERTAHAVTFKVPDRNSDGATETIRYSWSGTAGDAVLLTYNGGTPAPLATGLRAFNLTYWTRPVTGTGFVKGLLDDASLKAWWRLDESSGTVAADTTIYANHGTATGGIAWYEGCVGNSLGCNGWNAYVAVPHNAVLSIADEITITAWLWLDWNGWGGRRAIVSKGTAADTFNYYLLTDTGRLLFGFYNGGAREYLSPNTLNAYRWYHVAATMEISGTGRLIRLYEDGVQVASQTSTYQPLTNSQSLTIGTKQLGAYWSGGFDDIRIYNRKLSADEILQVKNGVL
jgi:prepilin-type N-terminal cleavage/methylation domain-containing protein